MCPARSLSATAASSRLARSFTFHTPFANSSDPAMRASLKPRFSAYWNCWPSFFASGKTSTAIRASRRLRAMRW